MTGYALRLGPVLLCGLVLACGSSDPHQKSAASPRAATLVGYGVANGWHHADPREFARTLRDNGLTVTVVEAVPWDNWVSRDGASHQREDHICACEGRCAQVSHPEQLARFVVEMRNHGITTLVSLVNWNACPAKSGTDQWFRDRLDEVLALGPDGIILAPVTEPWSAPSKPKRWTDMARAAWSGLFALPSRGGSSPDPMWPIPHDFVDIHYCSDGALSGGLARGNPGLLHSTDCTPMGELGPERAARFTREALDSGSHLVVFDWRHGWAPDLAVIEAMGREVRSHMGSVR